MAAQKAHYHNGYQILAVCIYYISEELQATIELKKYLVQGNWKKCSAMIWYYPHAKVRLGSSQHFLGQKKSQKMVWELCQMLINRGWNCHSRKSERLWLLGLSFTVLRCEWPHFFSSKSRVECEFDIVSLFVLFLFNDHV